MTFGLHWPWNWIVCLTFLRHQNNKQLCVWSYILYRLNKVSHIISLNFFLFFNRKKHKEVENDFIAKVFTELWCTGRCKSEFNRSKSKVIVHPNAKTKQKQSAEWFLWGYKILFVFYCSLCSFLATYSTSSKFGRIVQKLGIPEPPKRPLNGFIRFQQENKTALKQSAKSQQDLFALVATKWRSLSAEQKEKYSKPFNTEIVSERLKHSKSFTKRFSSCSFVQIGGI